MDQEYTYSISHENSLVRVRSSGIFDYLKALEMWKEITATCEENQCFRILFLSNMAEPLPVSEAFDAAEFFKATGVTAKHRLAVVTSNPDVLESIRISESVLRKRSSFNAAVFESTKEATRWLDEGD